jgi:hypothetical protein
MDSQDMNFIEIPSKMLKGNEQLWSKCQNTSENQQKFPGISINSKK